MLSRLAAILTLVLAVPGCAVDPMPDTVIPPDRLVGIDRVVALPGDALVGAGRSEGASTRLSVVRFAADGTIDPTYGEGGEVALDDDLREATVSALLSIGDGSVLMAVRYTGGGGAVARITSYGVLDATFGEHGVLPVPGGPGALAAKPDGGFLIGVDSITGTDQALATDAVGSGLSRVGEGGFSVDGPFVARAVCAAGDRVAAAGVIDEALHIFIYAAPGVDGTFAVRPGNPYLDPRDLATVDGGFVIGGVMFEGAGFGAVRLHADGEFDDEYGSGNVARTNVTSVTAATLADAAGGVLLVGSTDGETPHPRAIRLGSGGSLDREFGTDGVFTDDSTDATIAHAAMLADGSVVAVGATSNGHAIVTHYAW